MKAFRRGLSDSELSGLRAAMVEPGHWWRELMMLWAPSGRPSESNGLRLAIRDRYLNFYRLGQSVAKVTFSGGHPQLSVHGKYVLRPGERGDLKLGYAKLAGDRLVLAGGREIGSYLGGESLRLWIQAINEDYAYNPHGEKRLIDGLLDHPANSNVIDLEMALPAWGERTTAPRMDLVTLEDVAGRLVVVFGEVKTVTDGRIRCSKGHVPDELPEVRVQLARYREYLAQLEHRNAIGAAYARTAHQLSLLSDMAAECRGKVELADQVQRAASGECLDVATEAVLIVLREVDHSADHWEIQREPFLSGVQPIKLRELPCSGPLGLSALV